MLELSLAIRDVEGGLLRVLGAIERRGFRLAAVNTRTAPHGLDLDLSIEADGRPAEVLLRQVARLHEVMRASIDVVRSRGPVARAPT